MKGRQLSEEQKRRMAEGRARAKAEKEAAARKAAELQETKDQLMAAKPAQEDKTEIEALKALVMRLQEQLATQKPQIVQISADTEKVLLRFQAEVADDNLATFGAGGLYGQVTGKSGLVVVPKSEWSRFYNEQNKYLLDNRMLIVLSGLDEDELAICGLKYREDEILDQKAFHGLLDMGRDLIAIFPKLCAPHKEMVATRFITGYEQGHPTAHDRDLVVALNELSRKDFEKCDSKDPRKKGLFMPIIRQMNSKDGGEEN